MSPFSSLALGIASPLLAVPSPAQAAAPAAVGTHYYRACVDGVAGEGIEVEVRFSVGIQVDRFASLALALNVGGLGGPGPRRACHPCKQPIGGRLAVLMSR